MFDGLILKDFDGRATASRTSWLPSSFHGRSEASEHAPGEATHASPILLDAVSLLDACETPEACLVGECARASLNGDQRADRGCAASMTDSVALQTISTMTVCSRPFERVRTIAGVSIGRDSRTDAISVSFRNYQFAGPSDPVIELPVARFARKPIARRPPKRPAIWPHCAYPDLHGYQDQAQDLRALRPHV
jgi:hypothetical protein